MEKIKEKEIIHKKIEFLHDTKDKTVKIFNFSGAIDIKGHKDPEIQLKVEKTIIAHRKQKLEQAKEAVGLVISKSRNTVIFYLESPYTNKDGSGKWETEKIGYEVQMDFELKVPYYIHLFLKVVNVGIINVRDINGDCTIKSVNGSTCKTPKETAPWKSSTVVLMP
jgi:hypothetical protein